MSDTSTGSWSIGLFPSESEITPSRGEESPIISGGTCTNAKLIIRFVVSIWAKVSRKGGILVFSGTTSLGVLG